eukprot:scaffold46387_cov252-Amphora_coffeaeformis.AAC.1
MSCPTFDVHGSRSRPFFALLAPLSHFERTSPIERTMSRTKKYFHLPLVGWTVVILLRLGFALAKSDAMEEIFPSAEATIVASPFDSVSLFAPDLLSQLYPEFAAPHYVQDTIQNSCPYGVDGVLLDLPAKGDNLIDETVLAFALMVNGVYVAETSVTKMSPNIIMEDLIYPPITDEILTIKLVVVAFDGKIDAGIAPGGIELLPSDGANFVLSCAPPHAIKGEPYKSDKYDPLKYISIEAKKKRKLGKLDGSFRYCKTIPDRTILQYLPDTARPGPLYPKEKFYQDCGDSGSKRVLLPVPNEPFKALPPKMAVYFDVDKSKLEVDKIPKEEIDGLHEMVCGGSGKSGTL